MRLSEYATKHGIQYRTAWNRFKENKIPGAYQDDGGRIVVPDPDKPKMDIKKVAIYARASNTQRRGDLDAQAKRLTDWAISNGFEVTHIVKEVGSGVSDKRKKLHALLAKDDYGTLLVEHKDRLTRFGFEWFVSLLAAQGKEIQVLRPPENEEADIIADLTAIVYSFTARLYGQRRASRAQEAVQEVLDGN